jgi:hypothetical protein
LLIGDINELNSIYDAAVVAEEQKMSDKTIRTHLTTTKGSRGATQPKILPKQNAGKQQDPFPLHPTTLLKQMPKPRTDIPIPSSNASSKSALIPNASIPHLPSLPQLPSLPPKPPSSAERLLSLPPPPPIPSLFLAFFFFTLPLYLFYFFLNILFLFFIFFFRFFLFLIKYQ